MTVSKNSVSARSGLPDKGGKKDSIFSLETLAKSPWNLDKICCIKTWCWHKSIPLGCPASAMVASAPEPTLSAVPILFLLKRMCRMVLVIYKMTPIPPLGKSGLQESSILLTWDGGRILINLILPSEGKEKPCQTLKHSAKRKEENLNLTHPA